MARILLISANNHCVPYPVYPIGLAYISTYLKEKMPESELRLFDVNKGNSSDLEALINKFQPQYTGISFRNIDDANSMNKESFIEDYRNLVNQIRLLSDSIIIAGGAGFSLFAEVLYKELQPDYGVYGEGEASLVSLIKSLETGGNPNTIPGLVFADKEKVVVNRDRNQYSDLRLNFDDQLIDYYWDKSGMLNIQTKRGCPHSCIYCSYPVIEGTKVRNLNPDKIVQTLVHLYRDKKVNYVFFTDSVFNLGKSYNRELAEKIIETGIHMKWGAYFSPKDLDVETLSLFKKAGLKHIEFGTESMSNAVLKSYNKHFTVKDVLDVSENCNVAGVYFAHFLILGGYGETNETVQETFENSKKIKNSVFFPFIGMRIYPGTKLQEIAIQEGVISAEDNLLEPKYYISKNVVTDGLKEKALATGQKWVFPDEELPDVIELMRQKKRKGPLWHLIR